MIEAWESVGPRTMDFRYEIDQHLHFFPPGLKQDAEYRSEYDPVDQWLSLPIDFIDTYAEINGVNQTVTGLHPYTLYTVRVRMRSKKSNESAALEMSNLLWLVSFLFI